MIKLNKLSTYLKHVTVQYLDIVNYENAKENICGYIFLLSRLSKDAEPTEKNADGKQNTGLNLLSR